MKIVLDSNVLFSDFAMKKPQMLLLERHLARSSAELCIPEVVIEETIRNFKSEYQDALNKCNKAAGLLKVVAKLPAAMPSSDEVVIDYRAKLTARLKELKARTLPMPTTPIFSLFKRYLEKRRPFLDGGKGFNDALIWETILTDCHSHDEKIVFVTEDYDFGVKSDQDGIELHPDLVRELKDIGFSDDRVFLVKGLEAFNDKFVHSLLTKVDAKGESGVKDVLPRLLAEKRDFLANALYEALPNLLKIKRDTVENIKLLRWPEDVKLIEAFDLVVY